MIFPFVLFSIPVLEPIAFRPPQRQYGRDTPPRKIFKADDQNPDVARFTCGSGDTIRLFAYGNDNLSFKIESINFSTIQVGDRVQLKLVYESSPPLLSEMRVLDKFTSPYSLRLRLYSVQEKYPGCFYSVETATLPFYLSQNCQLRILSASRLPTTSHPRTSFTGTDEHLLKILLVPDNIVSSEIPSYIFPKYL